MVEGKGKIVLWLPSPLGDAVMCTPAIKAVKDNMPDKEIFFVGGEGVRQLLSPEDFAAGWIDPADGMLKTMAKLRREKFETAILFKNSFSCALAVFLAGIPRRVGYYRDGRRLLLTDGKLPLKENGRYKPAPMMDYYNGLLECLGIEAAVRKLSLEVSAEDERSAREKLPEVFDSGKPVAVLVPGGAFGQSKCWLPENFAAVADYLAKAYNAIVVVSVAPDEVEIANQISSLAENRIVNLAEKGFSLGELKALINHSTLMIANDTGPRHIAIALDKNVITLFGPNDPRWTDSKYPGEIQLISSVQCAPCQKPVCPKGDNVCMRDISVESVCAAADKMFSEK